MTNLVTHIRDVIDEHPKRDCDNSAGVSCGCGAQHVADHPSHVAQAIIDRLGLRPQSADGAGKAVGDKIRYVSALFDEELTTLEGAE